MNIKEIRNCIFVYEFKDIDSLGIYIADNDSKEDAYEDLKKTLMGNLSATNEMEKKRLKEIENSISIWTWEEYQAEQGLNISERLLEIIH